MIPIHPLGDILTPWVSKHLIRVGNCPARRCAHARSAGETLLCCGQPPGRNRPTEWGGRNGDADGSDDVAVMVVCRVRENLDSRSSKWLKKSAPRSHREMTFFVEKKRHHARTVLWSHGSGE